MNGAMHHVRVVAISSPNKFSLRNSGKTVFIHSAYTVAAAAAVAWRPTRVRPLSPSAQRQQRMQRMRLLLLRRSPL